MHTLSHLARSRRSDLATHAVVQSLGQLVFRHLDLKSWKIVLDSPAAVRLSVLFQPVFPNNLDVDNGNNVHHSSVEFKSAPSQLMELSRNNARVLHKQRVLATIVGRLYNVLLVVMMSRMTHVTAVSIISHKLTRPAPMSVH